MHFSRVFIKALITILPLTLIGCGSDSGSNQPPDTPASTPTAAVAAPTTTNLTPPVIAPTTTTEPLIVFTPASAPITVAPITTMATAPILAPNPTTFPMMTPTMLDIRDLTERLATLSAIMNLGAALDASTLDGLFISNPNYGTSNGQARAENIASIVAIFGPNGTNSNGKLKTINNVQIVSDQTASYANRGVTKAYLLNYDFIFENGSTVHGNDVTFGKESTSGQWKFIGSPDGSNIGNNYGCVITSVSGTLQNIQIIQMPDDPPVTLSIQPF